MSESEQKSESDSDGNGKPENGNVAKNGKDSFLSNKQKFLDVFTRTTPIFSSIDESWSPTNSMNQEVINFQEELLNFEADSLNPPDESTKGMSFKNAKAIRKLSFEEMEVDNFEKERNKLKEKNERNTNDMTILKKGYDFFSRKISEDKEKEKVHNFGQNKTSPEKSNESLLSKTQTDSASVDKNVVSKSQINTNPRGKESIPTKTKEDATLKPAFQNGFLNLKREEKIEKAVEAEEKKSPPKISLTSDFKHRFLSSFSFEKSPSETLESSIFGSKSTAVKTKETDKEKNPRKKSVHFETDTDTSKAEWAAGLIDWNGKVDQNYTLERATTLVFGSYASYTIMEIV